MSVPSETLLRAEGCLLGQLAGDSLGSLVEFQSPREIRHKYPNGVRVLADGGTWGTIAGQPTDDSEMALVLARMLMKQRRYDPEEARKAYVFWLVSSPFDCGMTVSTGLRGDPNRESQANGAMMRISPLGIFCCNLDREQTSEFAQQDAALTHPHPVCVQANALFTMAIADAIGLGRNSQQLYEQIRLWAAEMSVEKSLMKAIFDAADHAPIDYLTQQGWVLIAFQNALWQLLHADSMEEGVVDTVMRGGDTAQTLQLQAPCWGLSTVGRPYQISGLKNSWPVVQSRGGQMCGDRARSAFGRSTPLRSLLAWLLPGKSSLFRCSRRCNQRRGLSQPKAKYGDPSLRSG